MPLPPDAVADPVVPEAQRASSALLYRSLFEHAPVEVHLWRVVRDAQGSIRTWILVDANPAALAAWNRRREDVLGRSVDKIFPGAGAVETFLPVIRKIMASGRPTQWEAPFAGTGQTLRMVSIPVEDCFVSTGFDVTSERQRQRELELALQRVTQATQAGGVGLWDWDLRTHAVHYSDEWKRQLGHEPHEIADTFEEWRSRVHPDDLEPTLEGVRATLEDPRRPYDVVFRMRHKDGTWRSILAQSSVLKDAAGEPLRMVGSHIDITERRRLEERVRQTQKLESLGTLAAGIAHDFNNLLTAITGNLSLLRGAEPGAPEVPVLLQSLEDASVRATALTRQLLAFAKGGTPVRELASIRELIIDSATFVTRGARVRCLFDIAEDLAAVNADVGQLGQVIDNLVINAMQAMPQGGTIHVGARNVAARDEVPPGLPPGRVVCITVADAGVGIAPALLSRIFDPFFTTKASGSGLGLSSCHTIVERHGGCITVESTLGRGTTFAVWLPASEGPVRAPVARRPVPGTGRVLVMDDDPTLRILLERMLHRLGYDADTCGGGAETVAAFSEALRAGRAYDAVILDLTMPGDEGGADVLRRLQALQPDVSAIVASGYAVEDVLAEPAAHGFAGRLHKPFDLTALSIELKRVLGSAPVLGGTEDR
jgi:PAS domain S-box-containing protein